MQCVRLCDCFSFVCLCNYCSVFDRKALCDDVEIDLSPDSACLAESDLMHSDQAHDREFYTRVTQTILD